MLVVIDHIGVMSVFALANSTSETVKMNDKKEDVTCICRYLEFLYNIYDTYKTNRIIICEEGGSSLRRNISPIYKMNRKERDPIIEEKLNKMFEQDHILIDILKEAGFQVEKQFGYEADDLIGSVAKNNKDEDVLILSQDKDMLQLVSANVKVLSYRKNITYDINKVKREFKVTPEQFGEALAIAGDTSDNVIGVPRVGFKTAASYMNGSLPKHVKAYKAIEENKDIIELNRKLVVLPLSGVSQIHKTEVCYSINKFEEKLKEYGMGFMCRGAQRIKWQQFFK